MGIDRIKKEKKRTQNEENGIEGKDDSQDEGGLLSDHLEDRQTQGC